MNCICYILYNMIYLYHLFPFLSTQNMIYRISYITYHGFANFAMCSYVCLYLNFELLELILIMQLTMFETIKEGQLFKI